MSVKFFKNAKHARRRLSEVFLSIQAVDKKLKPSYLWDAFSADVSEIKMYLEDLYVQKLIDYKLNALSVDDTIFVTQYDSLKQHIESCFSTNMYLINVSETVNTPTLLSTEEKTEVLKPIMQCSREIINCLNSQNENTSIDYTLCNLSTLFGILLGYPVLYWFSHQSPYADFACLSMVPLKVYKIISSICMPSDCSNNIISTRNFPTHHELFSFSIPDVFSKETDCVVKNWFHSLTCKNQSNSIFNDMKIKADIISLPSVSM